MVNHKTWMAVLVLPLVILVTGLGCTRGNRQVLEHAAPESVGFSSQMLAGLPGYLEKAGSSALLVVVKGKVIFEWGAVDRKHIIHSIRKALLNSLYGIKAAEGVIDLNATLKDLRIDDSPPLGQGEKRARIVDLLKSRSGVYHPAAGVSPSMLAGMPERGAHAPGEHFYYNNWDFNTLGYILEQKTSESLYTLFEKEIARPLGMTAYKGSYVEVDGEAGDGKIPDTDGFYQFEKSKSRYPAYHFRMTARDLARYGLLYLNRGVWKGQRIIPEAWIARSTTPYSVMDEKIGLHYGMLWYVLDSSRVNWGRAFLHTGMGIHLLAVFPDRKMVVVHRVDTENPHRFTNKSLFMILAMVHGAAEKPGR